MRRALGSRTLYPLRTLAVVGIFVARAYLAGFLLTRWQCLFGGLPNLISGLQTEKPSQPHFHDRCDSLFPSISEYFPSGYRLKREKAGKSFQPRLRTFGVTNALCFSLPTAVMTRKMPKSNQVARELHDSPKLCSNLNAD